METFKFKTHVGSDGILKLEVPVGIRDADCEVVIVFTEQPKTTKDDWAAFIEATYGSLADDPIERGDQGTPEVRDEIL